MKLSLPVMMVAVTELVAGSATQTDWSGGPGILGGDVVSWDSTFWESNCISWYHNGGMLTLDRGMLHFLPRQGGQNLIDAADFDGDGDVDMATAMRSLSRITIWRNIDGLGTVWTQTLIGPIQMQKFHDFHFTDIDSDGDMDISYLSMGSMTGWFRNVDGLGGSWIYQTIDSSIPQPCRLCVGDLNGDGRPDLAAGTEGDPASVFAYINPGIAGVWVRHTVTDSLVSGDKGLCMMDFDGDGDEDIAGICNNGGLFWWRNDDGLGSVWSQHGIGALHSTHHVAAADIDGDGDGDLITPCRTGGDAVAWWENLDGVGLSWVRRDLPGPFPDPCSVCVSDLDQDGTLDVVASSEDGDKVCWWSNPHGSGDLWVRHDLPGGPMAPLDVLVRDMNSDGCMDVVTQSYMAGIVEWWDLQPYAQTGWLESTALCTIDQPVWGSIDWECSEQALTSIGFQVRTGFHPSLMGDWSDTLYVPTPLVEHVGYGHYIQYRAILSSQDPYVTPGLEWVTVDWSVTGVGDQPGQGVLFGPVRPDPAGACPEVDVVLEETVEVELEVFDLSGRRIDSIRSGTLPAGRTSIGLGSYESGVYLVRMTAGSSVCIRRFVVIR